MLLLVLLPLDLFGAAGFTAAPIADEVRVIVLRNEGHNQ